MKETTINIEKFANEPHSFKPLTVQDEYKAFEVSYRNGKKKERYAYTLKKGQRLFLKADLHNGYILAFWAKRTTVYEIKIHSSVVGIQEGVSV